MYKKFLHFFFPFLLLLVAIFTHFIWFMPGSILFSWDFNYWPTELVSAWPLLGPGTYNSHTDFGLLNFIVSFNVFFAIWGFLQNYDFALQLTLLIPAALLSLFSPYFLIKYLFKDERIAFVSALSFAFVTSLMYLQLSHIPLAFTFALSPLVLLFFIKFLREKTFTSTLLFVLVYSIGVWYEARIMYIVTYVLFFYWLIFAEYKNLWKQKVYYLLLLFFFIGLNLFWTLPVTQFTGSVSEISERGLTEESANTLLYAFSDFKHKWTGGLVTQTDILQKIPWTFWILPVFAFSVLLVFRKIKDKEDRKHILFFAFIALLGIFLSKQSDEPFAGVYLWLYENFPGFGLFRTGSKFLVLVTLGYVGLFAYGLKYVILENSLFVVFDKYSNFFRNKFLISSFLRSSILVGFVLLFLWNAKPLFTRDVGNLFVAREEPKEYEILNTFLQNQHDFFRVLWIPKPSQWAYYNSNQPRVSADSVDRREFLTFLSAVSDEKKVDDIVITDLLKTDLGNQLFDLSSIKYVIVPLYDTQDELLYKKETDYGHMVSKVSQNIFLEEVFIDDIKKIKIYENKKYLNPIFLVHGGNSLSQTVADDSHSEILVNTSTKKQIVLDNIRGTVKLVFNDRFDRGWKVIPDFTTRQDRLRDLIPFFTSGKMRDQKHDEFVGFMNMWTIDVEQYCTDFAVCEKNKDGTFDVHVVIEYWPQRWYYLGVILSSFFVFLWISFFVYCKRKKI